MSLPGPVLAGYGCSQCRADEYNTAARLRPIGHHPASNAILSCSTDGAVADQYQARSVPWLLLGTWTCCVRGPGTGTSTSSTPAGWNSTQALVTVLTGGRHTTQVHRGNPCQPGQRYAQEAVSRPTTGKEEGEVAEVAEVTGEAETSVSTWID